MKSFKKFFLEEINLTVGSELGIDVEDRIDKTPAAYKTSTAKEFYGHPFRENEEENEEENESENKELEKNEKKA